MALVAMMRAASVQQHGGKPWQTCNEDDEGAVPLEVAFKDYAQPPKWLRGAEYVQLVDGVSHEMLELNCVYSGDPDDPNAEFSLASPSGKLTLTVHNPAAMGYVKPGRAYRITIEEVRGPRKQVWPITVNTRPFKVGGTTISYEEILELVELTGQPSVLYHCGERSAIMKPGDEVDLMEGMHFEAMHTTSA